MIRHCASRWPSWRESVSRESWIGPQARAYVGVFDELLANSPRPLDAEPLGDLGSGAGTDERGRVFVDLTDAPEFERFILERS
jgi:hypothetical protein